MSEEKRERVTLVRRVEKAAGVIETETIEVDIVWICGRPSSAESIGQPAPGSSWVVASRLGTQLIAPVLRPKKAKMPAEPATPPVKKEKQPYEGKYKAGDKVVLITVDEHDKKVGCKKGMRGTVTATRDHCYCDVDLGMKDGPVYLNDVQLILEKDYIEPAPKHKSKGKS